MGKKMLYAFENFQKLIKHTGLILLNEAQQEQGGDSKHLCESGFILELACAALCRRRQVGHVQPKHSVSQGLPGVAQSALPSVPKSLHISNKPGSSPFLRGVFTPEKSFWCAFFNQDQNSIYRFWVGNRQKRLGWGNIMTGKQSWSFRVLNSLCSSWLVLYSYKQSSGHGAMTHVSR